MILYLNYEWDNSCVCINTDKGKEYRSCRSVSAFLNTATTRPRSSPCSIISRLPSRSRCTSTGSRPELPRRLTPKPRRRRTALRTSRMTKHKNKKRTPCMKQKHAGCLRVRRTENAPGLLFHHRDESRNAGEGRSSCLCFPNRRSDRPVTRYLRPTRTAPNYGRTES